jgi:hypothetical protein
MTFSARLTALSQVEALAAPTDQYRLFFLDGSPTGKITGYQGCYAVLIQSLHRCIVLPIKLETFPDTKFSFLFKHLLHEVPMASRSPLGRLCF